MRSSTWLESFTRELSSQGALCGPFAILSSPLFPHPGEPINWQLAWEGGQLSVGNWLAREGAILPLGQPNLGSLLATEFHPHTSGGNGGIFQGRVPTELLDGSALDRLSRSQCFPSLSLAEQRRGMEFLHIQKKSIQPFKLDKKEDLPCRYPLKLLADKVVLCWEKDCNVMSVHGQSLRRAGVCPWSHSKVINFWDLACVKAGGSGMFHDYSQNQQGGGVCRS